MKERIEEAIERFKSIFKREEWEERFLVGKKKAKKLLEKLRKQARTEMTTESMELFDYYGVPVAEYRVVLSKRDIYSVIDEMGLPVIVKSETSKAVHRGDIGGVVLITEKSQVEEAYPQILGEIATHMPWVSLTGIVVQEYVPGDDKCWIKIERAKKSLPFKVWWKKIIGKNSEEKEIQVKDKNDMDSIGLEEEFAGIFAFALQFKEVKKIEADFVRGREGWMLVDSKVWLFD